MQNTFTIAIVGDRQVGKSTLIDRLDTGSYNRDYVPTENTTMTSSIVHTNNGYIRLRLLEVPYLPDEACDDIDGAIIVFDCKERMTYDSIPAWREMFKHFTDNIVVCGNKVDAGMRTEPIRERVVPNDGTYYDVSARDNHGFTDLILAIIRPIVGNDTVLVQAPAFIPPIVGGPPA